MKEKEKKKEKKTKKQTNKKNQQQQQQNKTKQENYMIKYPLVTLLYMEKHAVYFEFLKRFIDISFFKTVRRISF